MAEDAPSDHRKRFPDGVLRSLQRHVRRWRALEGRPKEVFFPQDHVPGHRGLSDFTVMGKLCVMIANAIFVHNLQASPHSQRPQDVDLRQHRGRTEKRRLAAGGATRRGRDATTQAVQVLVVSADDSLEATEKLHASRRRASRVLQPNVKRAEIARLEDAAAGSGLRAIKESSTLEQRVQIMLDARQYSERLGRPKADVAQLQRGCFTRRNSLRMAPPSLQPTD